MAIAQMPSLAGRREELAVVVLEWSERGAGPQAQWVGCLGQLGVDLRDRLTDPDPAVRLRAALAHEDAAVPGADFGCAGGAATPGLGSSGSRTAADAAFTQARLRDAELILAYQSAGTSPASAIATSDVPFWRAVGDSAADAHGISVRYPDVEYRTEVLSGDSAAAALMTLSRRTSASLLVVGSRGLGGFRGLVMGSTSRSLIDHAPCPVMVVPSDRDAD